MPNIIDVLEQDKVWYGQDGRPYKLEDMEQSHRINTLAFLRRRANSLYEHKFWTEMRDLRNAPDEVMDLYWNAAEVTEDPVQWLERRPLVRALEACINKYDAIEPDLLSIEGGQ